MGKKKQIAIAESNLCNFGTDLEKQVHSTHKQHKLKNLPTFID